MDRHRGRISDESHPHRTEPLEEGIQKTTPIIRDFGLNPSCSHGPTILFERGGQRYFSCSAYRSRKLCQFQMPEEKWLKKLSKASASLEDTETEEGKSNKVSEKPEKEKKKKNDPITNPNQRDKGEAQYHFNEKTVSFFMDQFENLEVDSVLCVGTPSLHQHIVESGGKLKSHLLDIDHRFAELYKEDFSLYNMCNHHFFKDSTKYREFIGNSNKLALVVDPPFGVKVEVISHGCIESVSKDLQEIHGESISLSGEDSKLEIFWIFPYFMEGHILNKCQKELKMSDFHVEYRNHPKYSGSKNKSSPIRIFTSVELSNLPLPEEDYRYCNYCNKWVDEQNIHCDACDTCPTKDGGGTYIHCFKCIKCVKPTWKHCFKCKTCHLNDFNSCKQGHNSTFRQLKHFDSIAKKKYGNKKSPNNKLKRMNPGSVNIKKNFRNKNANTVPLKKHTNKKERMFH